MDLHHLLLAGLPAHSGPRPEILFAKASLRKRIEPKGERGFKSPARRAANRKRICRQLCLWRGEGCSIAEVGRRVRAMDDSARSIDRRVPDKPEFCLIAHARLSEPGREQYEDRGLTDL